MIYLYIITQLFVFLSKPEYLALLLSGITIVATVYIAHCNRRYDLAKEEYFKLQQVAEKIISKLILLDSSRERLRVFFQLTYDANKDRAIFIDSNDSLNKENFEKNVEEIVAYIHIYFPELGDNWNDCLMRMSDMSTIVFLVNENRKAGNNIDWKKEAEKFNLANRALGVKPKEIADKVKTEINKFKVQNL